jgi:hypothetical protein
MKRTLERASGMTVNPCRSHGEAAAGRPMQMDDPSGA